MTGSDNRDSLPLDSERISGAISKILENPELVGMLGSMLSASKPAAHTEEKSEENSNKRAEDNTSASANEKQENSTVSAANSDMLATLAPMLSRLGSAAHSAPKKEDSRECLLIALKPYLSKERCEAIDQMLKIGRITELLKNMS